MGLPKAAVELRGRPLISYPIAAARLGGLAPFVVAKEDSRLPELSCQRLLEPAEPAHPLTGIIAALEHAEAPIVALACDLPLLPPELITELSRRRSGFAMPVHPRPQPLVARYSPGLLPRLRDALKEQRSLVAVAAELGGDLLGGPELRGYGDPERMFANVNDPSELREMERALG